MSVEIPLGPRSDCELYRLLETLVACDRPSEIMWSALLEPRLLWNNLWNNFLLCHHSLPIQPVAFVDGPNTLPMLNPAAENYRERRSSIWVERGNCSHN